MTKKEEVINGARELFCTYGYKKVTMDEIAKRSGVTKKTIYSYFKDKNDLIKYFVYEEIDKMKEIVSNVEKKDLSTVDRANEIIYSLLEYRKQEKLLKKFSEEAKELPLGIATECEEILNKAIVKEIKKLLEKGIKNKDVIPCDTDLASFLIYKLYLSLMFEWDKPLDKKEVTNSFMNLLKDGLFL